MPKFALFFLGAIITWAITIGLVAIVVFAFSIGPWTGSIILGSIIAWGLLLREAIRES